MVHLSTHSRLYKITCRWSHASLCFSVHVQSFHVIRTNNNWTFLPKEHYFPIFQLFVGKMILTIRWMYINHAYSTKMQLKEKRQSKILQCHRFKKLYTKQISILFYRDPDIRYIISPGAWRKLHAGCVICYNCRLNEKDHRSLQLAVPPRHLCPLKSLSVEC